jgi:hypothetical protein
LKKSLGPYVDSEFNPGWLITWGQTTENYPTLDVYMNSLKYVYSLNASFSMYMFHGGTNFGFNVGSQPTASVIPFFVAIFLIYEKNFKLNFRALPHMIMLPLYPKMVPLHKNIKKLDLLYKVYPIGNTHRLPYHRIIRKNIVFFINPLSNSVYSIMVM